MRQTQPAKGQIPGEMPVKSVEFALAAFTDARVEMLKRVEIRERLVELYFLISVSVFGAIAAVYKSAAPPMELFLVPSTLALAISYRLKSHVGTTEAIAEFLRRDLNTFLIHEGAWAPYWDWSTHADLKVNSTGKYGGIKKSPRFISDSMSLHFPCAISMVYLFFSTGLYLQVRSLWAIAIFSFGTFMFALAFHNTFKSYKDREATKKISAISSRDWHEIVRTTKEAQK